MQCVICTSRDDASVGVGSIVVRGVCAGGGCLHDDADGEEDVGVDALFGGGDGEGDVFGAGGVVEGEAFEFGEVEGGVAGFEDFAELVEDGGIVFHGVGAGLHGFHDFGEFDGDGVGEADEDVGGVELSGGEVEEDHLGIWAAFCVVRVVAIGNEDFGGVTGAAKGRENLRMQDGSFEHEWFLV